MILVFNITQLVDNGISLFSAYVTNLLFTSLFSELNRKLETSNHTLIDLFIEGNQIDFVNGVCPTNNREGFLSGEFCPTENLESFVRRFRPGDFVREVLYYTPPNYSRAKNKSSYGIKMRRIQGLDKKVNT